MSLKSTADELRERANDLRGPRQDRFGWAHGRQELARHLLAMADELDEASDA